MQHLRVGLCGFSTAMAGYAREFPVVEVQRTFYEPPVDAVMRQWVATTGPGLEYTMKVWQWVTHPRTSPTYRRVKRKPGSRDRPGYFGATAAVSEGWQRSVECARVLDATAMLFQCPASFTPDPANLRRIQRFFERIERPAARLLWEPRGVAWIERRDEAVAMCRALDLVHVVDPFVTPPARRMPIYWRLHGPGGAYGSYDDAQLRRLHAMVAEAQASGPAYVLFNNLPRRGDAQRFLRVATGSVPSELAAS